MLNSVSDVKLENILMTNTGYLKLSDFGVAKTLPNIEEFRPVKRKWRHTRGVVCNRHHPTVRLIHRDAAHTIMECGRTLREG